MFVGTLVHSKLFDEGIVSVVEQTTETNELSLIAEFKYFEGELVDIQLFKYFCLDDILHSNVVRIKNEEVFRTGLGKVILVI